jgi:hypothetical protein
MSMIVNHGGAQDDLIDVAAQRVTAILSTGDLTRLLCGRCCGSRRSRTSRPGRGDRITIDIERRLLFGGQRQHRTLLRQQDAAEG